VPDTEALITVKGTGGDQAAREMKKPVAALDAIAKQHKSLGSELAKRVEPAMIRAAMSELIQMTGVGAQASGMLRMLSIAFRGLYVALGPVGLAIAAIVTAVSLARGAFALYKKVTEENLKPHEELAKNLQKVNEQFEKLDRLGVKLSPEVERYRASVRKASDAEKDRRVGLMGEVKAEADAVIAADKHGESLNRIGYYLTGNKELLAKHNDKVRQATVASAELAASMKTTTATGKSVSDWIEDVTKRTEAVTAKIREYSRAITDAGSDSKTYYENELLNNDRWYEDQKRALDDAKADREAYSGLVEARAAREGRLNRDVQRQFSEGWMSATSGAQSAMSSFAASIIGHANNVTAAWGKFRDSLMRWMEELAAKALVTGLFSWMLGGVGGFMGGFRSGMGLPAMPVKQWGGVIPGPEGAPRLALVHGGETVTNQQGMGGGQSGGGGSLVFSPIFTGGIGGLDSRSQRVIVRQLRRLVKSVGERPLA